MVLGKDYLVTNEELAGFRGHPFDEALLDAVAETVRGILGWHVAPVVEETMIVRSRGSRNLVLPSLRVVEVLSVEDARTGEAVTGWFNWGDGVIESTRPFPEACRVTIQHGFEHCPASLFLPIVDEVLAAKAGGRIRSESLSARSVQMDTSGSTLTSDLVAPILARYKVGVRP